MDQLVTEGPVLSLGEMADAEEFAVLNAAELEEFLTRNGYTAREVRGIARHAIALWETQKK
jgi:hypothetical protein